MIVQPLKDKVLVAENKTSDKTSDAGIILDGANSVRDSRAGTVLAVGPEVTEVAVGDVIYLDWTKGSVVKVGDAQRVIVSVKDIVAVLEK